MSLKAPFPWFGGKSRAAQLVWDRLGNVPNYVEPFAGSLAVLLARPHESRIETVNDKDCYLANFWRAVQKDPEEVAKWADWPINEADLHARHRWLVDVPKFRTHMRRRPTYCSFKVAGWWVWGISQWIGSGWCSRPEWEGRAHCGRFARGIHADQMEIRPDLSSAGRGVHLDEKRPNNWGKGVHKIGQWNKRPNISMRSTQGVHRQVPEGQKPSLYGNKGVHVPPDGKRPRLASHGAGGTGVHAPHEKRPHLTSRGTPGVHSGKSITETRARREWLVDWMTALADRLRNVRVCCGDWSRVVTPSVTYLIGGSMKTGILLDPPYAAETGRDSHLYSTDCGKVAHEVREWAIENGDNPLLRIALCGYDGEHEMPSSWECVAWKANGGYGNATADGKGRDNAHRERIWFSPHCLKPLELFGDDDMVRIA
jgi:hypothetical protein